MNMKDNVEVIYFHVKRRGAQCFVFVQITSEKYNLNFYFENGKIDGFQFVFFISMERFCMLMHFYAASFSIKTCFYETTNVFISSTRRIFTKWLSVFESSVK